MTEAIKLRELIARVLYERHPAHWGSKPPEGEPEDGRVSWERARHNGVEESGWYADADAVLAALSVDRERYFVCDKCRAEKGEHSLGESCQNNCGGKVVERYRKPVDREREPLDAERMEVGQVVRIARAAHTEFHRIASRLGDIDLDPLSEDLSERIQKAYDIATGAAAGYPVEVDRERGSSELGSNDADSTIGPESYLMGKERRSR